MTKKRKRLVRTNKSYEQVTDDNKIKEFKPNLPLEVPKFRGELHDDEELQSSTSLHSHSRKISADRSRDIEDELEGEETLKPKKENNNDESLID